MQNLFIIYSSKNLEEDLKRLDDNAKVIALTAELVDEEWEDEDQVKDRRWGGLAEALRKLGCKSATPTSSIIVRTKAIDDGIEDPHVIFTEKPNVAVHTEYWKSNSKTMHRLCNLSRRFYEQLRFADDEEDPSVVVQQVIAAFLHKNSAEGDSEFKLHDFLHLIENPPENPPLPLIASDHPAAVCRAALLKNKQRNSPRTVAGRVNTFQILQANWQRYR